MVPSFRRTVLMFLSWISVVVCLDTGLDHHLHPSHAEETRSQENSAALSQSTPDSEENHQSQSGSNAPVDEPQKSPVMKENSEENHHAEPNVPVDEPQNSPVMKEDSEENHHAEPIVPVDEPQNSPVMKEKEIGVIGSENPVGVSADKKIHDYQQSQEVGSSIPSSSKNPDLAFIRQQLREMEQPHQSSDHQSLTQLQLSLSQSSNKPEECKENCDCAKPECSLPKCEKKCTCRGPKCQLPQCEWDCKCYGDGCEEPKCSGMKYNNCEQCDPDRTVCKQGCHAEGDGDVICDVNKCQKDCSCAGEKCTEKLPQCATACKCSGAACELAKCTQNCECGGKGCKLSECTKNCKCVGEGCELPKCTEKCKCHGEGCLMPKCFSNEKWMEYGYCEECNEDGTECKQGCHDDNSGVAKCDVNKCQTNCLCVGENKCKEKLLQCTQGCKCFHPDCELAACTKNCECGGNNCKLPECTENCTCRGEACQLPKCTHGCRCGGNGCDITKCLELQATALADARNRIQRAKANGMCSPLEIPKAGDKKESDALDAAIKQALSNAKSKSFAQLSANIVQVASTSDPTTTSLSFDEIKDIAGEVHGTTGGKIAGSGGDDLVSVSADRIQDSQQKQSQQKQSQQEQSQKITSPTAAGLTPPTATGSDSYGHNPPDVVGERKFSKFSGGLGEGAVGEDGTLNMPSFIEESGREIIAVEVLGDGVDGTKMPVEYSKDENQEDIDDIQSDDQGDDQGALEDIQGELKSHHPTSTTDQQVSENLQSHEGMMYISLIVGLMGIAAFIASMVEGFKQDAVDTVA